MISAVIITKNEAHIIGRTLESLHGIVDEIIVVDSGSTDETIAICKNHHARVIQTSWDGYGLNKNKGIRVAKNDWILNVDADEIIGPELKKNILEIILDKENIVYVFNFLNFYCNKPIKYGVWKNDKHIRLYNRKKVIWKDMAVHEELLLPEDVQMQSIRGKLFHYTYSNYYEYINKSVNYAKLSAEKYYLKKKKSGFIKLYIAPPFSFIKNFFFRLGFLDGWEGFVICKTNAWYSFIKYVFLKEMYKNE
jgi:glycosyltransferase involved in cell wall biosynthesis